MRLCYKNKQSNKLLNFCKTMTLVQNMKHRMKLLSIYLIVLIRHLEVISHVTYALLPSTTDMHLYKFIPQV